MTKRNVMRNVKLKGKILIYVILFILLPVLCLMTYYNFVIAEQIAEKEREKALNALQQSRMSIQYVLGEIDNISLMMLYDDSVQTLYRVEVLANPFDEKINPSVERRLIYDHLTPIVFNRPYVQSVLISSGEKLLFQFGEAVRVADMGQTERAYAAMGKAVWTSAERLKDTVRVNDSYYVSLLRAISDKSVYQKLIAVVRISFEESVLRKRLKEYDVPAGSVMLIADDQGRMVSSLDGSLLGGEIRDARLRDALSRATDDKGILRDIYYGEKKTGLYYRLDDPRWTVLQLVPDRTFYSAGAVLNLYLAGMILLCVLFALILSTVINKSVLYPISELCDEMGKIETGNFDISLTYASNDEIGQLNRRFTRMVADLKTLIDTRYKNQLMLKEAELKNLESQIHPHFLYNTLDSIHWIAVRNHDMQVSEQLEALSDLFRHMLNKGQEMTTVKAEVEYLKDYLLLQHARFGDRIHSQIRVDDTLSDMPVPKLLIQPLVENAIFHGLECKAGEGHVSVVIRREANDMVIEVIDDGVGADPEEINRNLALSDSGDSFALSNVHQRITMKYGSRYGVTFYANPGGGARVTLRLPCETRMGKDAPT